MIAPFFLWGSAMVVMKGTLVDTTPLFIAIVRLLPAGLLIIFARICFKPMRWPESLRGWLWLVLFALVDGSCFQGFLARGLQETSPGLGSVFIDSQPLAVALMASWFYKERLGILGWLSLMIGFLGIMTIGFAPHQMHISGGAGWMVLASLAMAIGTVMMPQVSRYMDPILATGCHMVLGSIPLVVLSLLTETHQWDLLQNSEWIGLIYTSVMGSAVAYGLFFFYASQENLAEFSSLTFLTPVFALLLGYVFLGDTLTLTQWIGVGITLLSVYLINHRQAWEPKLRYLFSLEPELDSLDLPSKI
jgi:drug/metabolite transporter (DMT)-like permease